MHCLRANASKPQLNLVKSVTGGNAIYPPGTLQNDDNCVAALCDNGASRRVTCFKTLDGAILDTLNENDAGELTVGAEDGALESQGSYVYVFEWFGSDGSGGLVARRAKHTPKLPIDAVISEPTEVIITTPRFYSILVKVVS